VTYTGTYTGRNCAAQGNILTGEDVVTAMETTFLQTTGTLADRLHAAPAKATTLNLKLRAQASSDSDFCSPRGKPRFDALLKPQEKQRAPFSFPK
jgi:hypothetical protein